MTVVRAHWDQIVATFGFTTVLFFHNRFNDFIHIHIAVQMGGLVEGLWILFAQRRAQMRKVDARTKLLDYINQIVVGAHAVRSGTHGEAVRHAINGFNHPLHVFNGRDNARQAENRARRIVRVNGHTHANQRQLKTLQQWEKEFKAATPEDDIELYTGKDVQQVIGSDVYCGVLKHMGGGHVHSLNLLLGSAQAANSLGGKIFEYSPVVEVSYGKTVRVRTAMGSVKAAKLLWACDSFLNNLEPEIYKKTLVTYSYQVSTEPLSSELVERISPLRGAFSDIRPVINYYRLTKENRLLFGSATRFLEYTPHDFAAWNRTLLTEVFPYLKDVKIDFAWGGPMACSANLFPQIGTLREHNNVFYVQGYSGFGVTPSHIVCKILAEGINGGSERYRLMSSIPHATIYGRDSLRLLLVSAGKLIHQTAGFWKGRN